MVKGPSLAKRKKSARKSMDKLHTLIRMAKTKDPLANVASMESRIKHYEKWLKP